MNYVDLAVTTSGDLYFETATQNNSLNLSFNLLFNDNESLKLSFRHQRLAIPDITDNSLKINLDYNNSDDAYKASCVYDTDVLKNRIDYALRTTLTDLKTNSDFGSDLELYMHQNIRNKTVIANIESVVSKALSGFLEAPTIKITPRVKLTGAGYFQGIIIEVYNFAQLVTSYTV